jgi:alpha-mannosidase
VPAVWVVNPVPWRRTAFVEVPRALFGGAAPEAVRTGGGELRPAQVRGDAVGFVTELAPWQVCAVSAATGTGASDVDWELTEDPPVAMLVGEQHPKQYFRFRNRFFAGIVRGDAGTIVSLVDNVTGREWVGHGLPKPATNANTARPELGLNVLQLLTSRPHAMSAWHHHEVAEELSLIDTGTSGWIERGPVFGTLRTVHRVGGSTVLSDLTVHRDLPLLEFRVSVDWQHTAAEGRDVPELKVAFTPALRDPRLHAGTAFGVARRYGTGQEEPFQRWLDVSDEDRGLTVFADDRHGYDAFGARVRLSLVRTAYDPSDNRDVGRHRFGYALLPHAGDWRAVRAPVAAEERALPPLAAPARSGARTALPVPALDPSGGALISSVTPVPGGAGAIAVRVREWADRSGAAVLTGIPAGTTAHEITLTGQPAGDLPVIGGELRLPLRPSQFRTVVLTPEP